MKKQLELTMHLKDLQSEWIFNTPHTLTNFEMQKYYQNESRFNEV